MPTLANCIPIMSNYSFSPMALEIINIVLPYVAKNEIENQCFMKDDREGSGLRLLWSAMVCLVGRWKWFVRLEAAENPFVIYEFYEMLEELINKENLSAEQVWNFDESSFPSDHERCKVTNAKGEFLRFSSSWGCGDFSTKYLYLGACTPADTVTGKGYHFAEDGET